MQLKSREGRKISGNGTESTHGGLAFLLFFCIWVFKLSISPWVGEKPSIALSIATALSKGRVSFSLMSIALFLVFDTLGLEFHKESRNHNSNLRKTWKFLSEDQGGDFMRFLLADIAYYCEAKGRGDFPLAHQRVRSW
ncbi:hypothetical protein ACLOJK_022803 [Asimina triloba]